MKRKPPRPLTCFLHIRVQAGLSFGHAGFSDFSRFKYMILLEISQVLKFMKNFDIII